MDHDIRRFQLPCNLTTDFKHLKEKLHSYYPSDVIGKISRIDEDGDAVNVDSDDDLKTAVAESADTGVVKLNVAVISGVATEIDNVVNDKNDDNNPVLSSLVYTAQTLGLDPTSCGHCDGGHSRDQRPTSVTGYLARMVTGVSVRVTKSVIVMGSLAIITGLSMILPSIIINTLIYMIIAASMGFPLATILSGHALFLFISLSPSYIVTLLSVWALRTILRSKKNYFIQRNLEYWNKVLDDIINKDDELSRKNVKLSTLSKSVRKIE